MIDIIIQNWTTAFQTIDVFLRYSDMFKLPSEVTEEKKLKSGSGDNSLRDKWFINLDPSWSHPPVIVSWTFSVQKPLLSILCSKFLPHEGRCFDDTRAFLEHRLLLFGFGSLTIWINSGCFPTFLTPHRDNWSFMQENAMAYLKLKHKLLKV